MRTSLPAQEAYAGPGARMDAPALHEVCAAAEGFAAHTTHIGLLPRVHLVVLSEVGHLDVGLAALVALVGLLPGVRPRWRVRRRSAQRPFRGPHTQRASPHCGSLRAG